MPATLDLCYKYSQGLMASYNPSKYNSLKYIRENQLYKEPRDKRLDVWDW